MDDMNQNHANIINWAGRIVTWLVPIATIVYMAGYQSASIGENTTKVGKLDNRMSIVEKTMSQSTMNAMRINRLDTTMADMTNKRANDHDTLTRVDQTVQDINARVSKVQADIEKLANRPQ